MGGESLKPNFNNKLETVKAEQIRLSAFSRAYSFGYLKSMSTTVFDRVVLKELKFSFYQLYHLQKMPKRTQPLNLLFLEFPGREKHRKLKASSRMLFLLKMHFLKTALLRYDCKVLGPGQTSHFSCAEPNC